MPALVQSKSDRSVELLHALCSCDGHAIPSNQDSIRQTIFVNERAKLLLKVKLENGQLFVQPTSDYAAYTARKTGPAVTQDTWLPFLPFLRDVSKDYFA
jgi:hypothetical protein